MKKTQPSVFVLIGLGLALIALSTCGRLASKGGSSGGSASPPGIPADWDGTSDYTKSTMKVVEE